MWNIISGYFSKQEKSPEENPTAFFVSCFFFIFDSRVLELRIVKWQIKV